MASNSIMYSRMTLNFWSFQSPSPECAKIRGTHRHASRFMLCWVLDPQGFLPASVANRLPTKVHPHPLAVQARARPKQIFHHTTARGKKKKNPADTLMLGFQPPGLWKKWMPLAEANNSFNKHTLGYFISSVLSPEYRHKLIREWVIPFRFDTDFIFFFSFMLLFYHISSILKYVFCFSFFHISETKMELVFLC